MRPCCKRSHLAQTKGILCWEPAMLRYLLKHFKVCECYTRTASRLKGFQQPPAIDSELTLGIHVSLYTQVAVAVLRFRKMVKGKMATG